MTEELRINFPRLQEDLNALSEIGRKADLGLYRMAFSAADMQARAWLTGRATDAGLAVHQDGAANVCCRIGNSESPCVMTGSHMDTVPGAGHLDGALGVVCGLEALRCLKEQGVELARPVELVAFTDEEGRFGGMFGSQALSGKLSPESIHRACDLNGLCITQAMADHGLNAQDALTAQRSPGSVHAFVELHIEQGPVLDHAGASVGVVQAITGLFKWNVRLLGVANHAGTTPMEMRRDAFQGLVEVGSAIATVLERHGGTNSRATIGRVELFPGAANVVPGKAEFTLEVRDTDPGVLIELSHAFGAAISEIARKRGLVFEFDPLSEITPVACHRRVIEAVTESVRSADIAYLDLPSGAAHDTQMMASIAPAGMIFVPSKEGRSHSPAEWTAWSDIETGANVLLNTLRRLAS